MNINLAPVDEAQLKQMVDDGHYISVAEAVRVAVKTFLRDSYLASPFYNAVMTGAQSLADGQGVPMSDELEDEIVQDGLAQSAANQKPSPDVVPH